MSRKVIIGSPFVNSFDVEERQVVVFESSDGWGVAIVPPGYLAINLPIRGVKVLTSASPVPVNLAGDSCHELKAGEEIQYGDPAELHELQCVVLDGDCALLLQLENHESRNRLLFLNGPDEPYQEVKVGEGNFVFCELLVPGNMPDEDGFEPEQELPGTELLKDRLGILIAPAAHRIIHDPIIYGVTNLHSDEPRDVRFGEYVAWQSLPLNQSLWRQNFNDMSNASIELRGETPAILLAFCLKERPPF